MAEKLEKRKEPNAIQKYIRETSGELHKVNWPTPTEAWNLTKVVLLVLLGMSILLGLLDLGFSKLIELMLA
jgi:preprotein translocase subunit SecE